MSNSYIKIPESISFNSIEEKDFTLSSSQYMDLIMPNKNFKFVRDFLSRPLKRADLGNEIGSINYIGNSPFHFLRTKALQPHTYLPEITSETAIPIIPKAFIKQNLKQGDLLISKDSNIGEVVILEKNKEYWGVDEHGNKLPFLDAIKYTFVKEKKSEMLEFQRGNLDMVFRIPIEMYKDIMGDYQNANARKTDFEIQT